MDSSHRSMIKKFDEKLAAKEQNIFIQEKRLKLLPADVNEAFSIFNTDKNRVLFG